MSNAVGTSTSLTVNGGVRQKIPFTTARDAAGTYNVTIDGLSGAFTVRAAAPPPPPPPTPFNWWLIGGIIAGVIIISLIIWIVIQRRSFA